MQILLQYILLRRGLALGEGVDVLLAEGGKATTSQLKWIHVATEGSYSGHQQGAFQLTRAAFREMVANFKGDPRFKLEAGTPVGKVVPFDYEHASEMPPTQGGIPTVGAPAPAWALDLEIRDGAGGKAQLWALAKLGATIQQQIADEEYAYVSIAFNPKAVHPNTGQVVGHRISSIAFTNTPFR